MWEQYKGVSTGAFGKRQGTMGFEKTGEFIVLD
jgi:hypothetical protein